MSIELRFYFIIIIIIIIIISADKRSFDRGLR